LQAVIKAADAARSQPVTPDASWPIHVLRAGDGSHYVAFSVLSPPGLPPDKPVVLYVRLATRAQDGAVTVAERSAVGEWLAGERSALLPPKRGVAFGEMPTFGAGAIAARGPGPQSLQLLEMERERTKEKREAGERDRKAELEGAGAARGPSPVLPFEDFDVGAVAASDNSGGAVLRRSLTTGPGEYDLIVGWADPSARDIAATVRVMRRALHMDVASTSAFALSSVIVADQVAVRDTPFGAGEQTAHPYSIGTTEIVPARDHSLTNDERLNLVVQAINPRSAPDGKPDVAVAFRLFRVTGATQEPVGTVAPQVYNQATLPADFDVTKGQPVFAAVAVPLRTFKRGTYRVQVLADDRLARSSATTDVSFTVVGTPAALLRDAPPLGPRYRRDAVLARAPLSALLSQLRQTAPSAAMAGALSAAEAHRFVDLVREDAVAPAELGARTLLRALALYAIGDTVASLAGPLLLASQQGAPAAAVQMLTGAVRASEGNDLDAIAAWTSAMAGGVDAAALSPLIIDAALRQNDWTRAADLAQKISTPGDGRSVRQLAAARIGAGREADAVPLLEQRLAQQGDDLDAQWLLLHALFSGFVKGAGPGAEPSSRARFGEVFSQYEAAGGGNAALAREWREAIF